MNARRRTDRTVLYIMSHPLSEVKCKICLFHECIHIMKMTFIYGVYIKTL